MRKLVTTALFMGCLALTGCAMEVEGEEEDLTTPVEVAKYAEEVGYDNLTCFIREDDGTKQIGSREGGYCTSWVTGKTGKCGTTGVYCD